MIKLRDWAIRHAVDDQAMLDLGKIFGVIPTHGAQAKGTSEAAVQSAVRLEAASKGVMLFRNNVGALIDARGVPVRYGLANESKAQNSAIKSADLIGWRPILITQAHVGCVLAQFVSRECKPTGWRYTGTEREAAQLAWAQLVVKSGGDAAFCADIGTL